MRALLTILGKDLRLLWRDRAGLIFLTIAPILVITVAGFSLANLYGSDPTGQTAYEFPLVDEDGGTLAKKIRERLSEERSVQLRPVGSRDEAERLVRRKRVGAALVIPRGTEAALRSGEPASLVLYVDSAKYLERLNVRARLLELRDTLGDEELQQVGAEAQAQRQRLQQELERLRSAVQTARASLETTWEQARRARERAHAEARAALERTRRAAEQQISRDLAKAAEDIQRDLQAQVAAVQEPVRAYLASLAAARGAFETWLAQLKKLAGSHAGDIPPPPPFPQLPPELQRVAADGTPLVHIPAVSDLKITLPAVRAPELPPVPEPPAIRLPEIALPNPPVLPGALGIQEINLSGGPTVINTFDQTVPGFSVTFLLLGMLLGVSLGLLDERDWGTLDRLRAFPIPGATILVGKLLSRFIVGIIQMVVLFFVGWVAFSISLGPQPWALALPTVGIVFAGTAFGLVVAALATSREAVLPIGSIVIVTMAAVGGCWWPIDLEPRWMRTVALAFPTTWAMDAFNDLMIRRRMAVAVLVPTAVMLGYGLLYLGVGVMLFSRRMRSGSA